MSLFKKISNFFQNPNTKKLSVEKTDSREYEKRDQVFLGSGEESRRPKKNPQTLDIELQNTGFFSGNDFDESTKKTQTKAPDFPPFEPNAGNGCFMEEEEKIDFFFFGESPTCREKQPVPNVGTSRKVQSNDNCQEHFEKTKPVPFQPKLVKPIPTISLPRPEFQSEELSLAKISSSQRPEFESEEDMELKITPFKDKVFNLKDSSVYNNFEAYSDNSNYFEGHTICEPPVLSDGVNRNAIESGKQKMDELDLVANSKKPGRKKGKLSSKIDYIEAAKVFLQRKNSGMKRNLYKGLIDNSKLHLASKESQMRNIRKAANNKSYLFKGEEVQKVKEIGRTGKGNKMFPSEVETNNGDNQISPQKIILKYVSPNDAERVEEYFWKYHVDEYGGHYSCKDTIKNAEKEISLKNIDRVFREKCNDCSHCLKKGQRLFGKKKVLPLKFNDWEDKENLMNKAQFDIFEMNLKDMGKRYFFHLVMIATKLEYVVCLENKSGDSCAKALINCCQFVDELFGKEGQIKILGTDNAKEFLWIKKNMQKYAYFRRNKISIIMCSPYHPESQGIIESSHKKVKKKILEYDNLIEGMEFDDVIQTKGIIDQVNSSEHSTTGFAPFDIVNYLNPEFWMKKGLNRDKSVEKSLRFLLRLQFNLQMLEVKMQKSHFQKNEIDKIYSNALYYVYFNKKIKRYSKWKEGSVLGISIPGIFPFKSKFIFLGKNWEGKLIGEVSSNFYPIEFVRECTTNDQELINIARLYDPNLVLFEDVKREKFTNFRSKFEIGTTVLISRRVGDNPQSNACVAQVLGFDEFNSKYVVQPYIIFGSQNDFLQMGLKKVVKDNQMRALVTEVDPMTGVGTLNFNIRKVDLNWEEILGFSKGILSGGSKLCFKPFFEALVGGFDLQREIAFGCIIRMYKEEKIRMKCTLNFLKSEISSPIGKIFQGFVFVVKLNEGIIMKYSSQIVNNGGKVIHFPVQGVHSKWEKFLSELKKISEEKKVLFLTKEIGADTLVGVVSCIHMNFFFVKCLWVDTCVFQNKLILPWLNEDHFFKTLFNFKKKSFVAKTVLKENRRFFPTIKRVNETFWCGKIIFFKDFQKESETSIILRGFIKFCGGSVAEISNYDQYRTSDRIIIVPTKKKVKNGEIHLTEVLYNLMGVKKNDFSGVDFVIFKKTSTPDGSFNLRKVKDNIARRGGNLIILNEENYHTFFVDDHSEKKYVLVIVKEFFEAETYLKGISFLLSFVFFVISRSFITTLNFLEEEISKKDWSYFAFKRIYHCYSEKKFGNYKNNQVVSEIKEFNISEKKLEGLTVYFLMEDYFLRSFNNLVKPFGANVGSIKKLIGGKKFEYQKIFAGNLGIVVYTSEMWKSLSLNNKDQILKLSHIFDFPVVSWGIFYNILSMNIKLNNIKKFLGKQEFGVLSFGKHFSKDIFEGKEIIFVGECKNWELQHSLRCLNAIPYLPEGFREEIQGKSFFPQDIACIFEDSISFESLSRRRLPMEDLCILLIMAGQFNPIISVKWVMDCKKNEVLLPYEPYFFYKSTSSKQFNEMIDLPFHSMKILILQSGSDIEFEEESFLFQQLGAETKNLHLIDNLKNERGITFIYIRDIRKFHNASNALKNASESSIPIVEFSFVFRYLTKFYRGKFNEKPGVYQNSLVKLGFFHQLFKGGEGIVGGFNIREWTLEYVGKFLDMRNECFKNADISLNDVVNVITAKFFLAKYCIFDQIVVTILEGFSRIVRNEDGSVNVSSFLEFESRGIMREEYYKRVRRSIKKLEKLENFLLNKDQTTTKMEEMSVMFQENYLKMEEEIFHMFNLSGEIQDLVAKGKMESVLRKLIFSKGPTKAIEFIRGKMLTFREEIQETGEKQEEKGVKSRKRKRENGKSKRKKKLRKQSKKATGKKKSAGKEKCSKCGNKCLSKKIHEGNVICDSCAFKLRFGGYGGSF